MSEVIKSKKSITNWREFYEQDTLTLNIETCQNDQNGININQVFTSERNMLPKMIVDTWKTRLLSELPTITDKSKNNLLPTVEPYLDKIVFNLLAWGEMFTLPLKINGNWIIQIINNYSNSKVSYTENNTDIVEFSYTTTEKRLRNNEYVSIEITNVYEYVNNVQYYWQVIDGTKQNETILSNQPVVKRHLLTFNSDCIGEPIYSSACTQIQGADLTLARMNMEEEVNKTEVGIPLGRMISNEVRSINKALVLPKSNKYVQLPGDENSENIYSGGKFNPEPYIKALNIKLNTISMLVGFGHRYLSYDESNSGVTTAKGVGANLNTLYASKEKLQQIISGVIIGIIHTLGSVEQGAYRNISYYKFSTSEEIDVMWKDNVFTTEDEKRDNLFKDYEIGIISKEYYLKEAYKLTQEEIQEAMTGTMIDGA